MPKIKKVTVVETVVEKKEKRHRRTKAEMAMPVFTFRCPQGCTFQSCIKSAEFTCSKHHMIAARTV